MAEGSPGPDMNALLQSLVNSSRAAGGGGSALLRCVPDANCGTSLSIQNNGLKADATFAMASAKRPGFFGNLWKDIFGTPEDLIKAFQQAKQNAPSSQTTVAEMANQFVGHGLGRASGGPSNEIV